MARPKKIVKPAKAPEVETDVQRRPKSKTREYAETIVLAILLALFIRGFVVEAFKIPSASMVPTLQIGDHLLVLKFMYGVKLPYFNKVVIPVGSPKRGDIVVFNPPIPKSEPFIKRVIGTPGDKVELRNRKLYINDAEVVDPYAHLSQNFGPVVVPEGKLFMMGDNRNNSADSRVWGFADIGEVIGKAFVIYWSWEGWKIRWGRLGNLIE